MMKRASRSGRTPLSSTESLASKRARSIQWPKGSTPSQPAKKPRVLLKTEAVPAATVNTRNPARAAVNHSTPKTKIEVRRRPAAPTSSLYKPRLGRHGASAAPGKAEGGAGPSMVDVDVAVGLQQLAKEKASLEARVTDLLGVEQEVHTLREKVRLLQEELAHMEQIQSENASLQAKLHSVTHSPLSDNEKRELLLGTRQHSSAPASMVASDLLLPAEENAPDVNLSMSPLSNWDRQSASSASQLSVACLQDRILQMEETHHSTNEELQATLQELTDLQSQLQELQAENERLLEENKILMESLCQQTEKLEESRNRTEALQGLLLQEGTEAVRDDQLVDLLKNAQEKRDCLLAKQQELTAQVTELRQSVESARLDAARSQEAARVLEATVDAMHAERKQLDEELAQARQESSSRHIEVQRLSTLLDNARAKIEELESARELEDKSDLDEMLDNVRKEKDTLESQVASLQEQVSRGQCEVLRLKEQLSHLQEECKVTRNNAKSALSDLEYQYETLKQEKQQLSTEVQVLQESVSELTMQCQCHLEDKRQLKALMSDCQRHLAEAESKLIEQGKNLDEEKKLRQQENEEWKQFQTDLLTTVRVANDFKTEANEEMKKLLIENKNLRDKTRIQEAQLEKLKAQKPASSVVVRPTSAQIPLESSSLSSAVHQEITLRHKGSSVSRQDSHLSVKSLIESIENATKQAKSGPRSRSSSTSSLSSIPSDVRAPTPVSVTNAPLTPSSQRRHHSETDNLFTKTPLRDQQQSNNSSNNMKSSQNRRNAYSDNSLGKVNLYDNLKNGKPSEDVPSTAVSILANKTMDFVRRNSYSDLSERKDPLSGLTKNGGSKRNALLKWCQNKTIGYQNIEITNFSSSWNDGLALCAILHSYLPERVPYDTLTPNEKRRNFTIAFAAAESVGIPTTLNVSEMMQLERPDWQQVMAYVTAIYKHFET